VNAETPVVGVGNVIRLRGAVTSGGDAAVGDVVADGRVVEDDVVVDGVFGAARRALDDPHAPLAITTLRSATHCNRPRRTPS
jgi:hypothetical protein